MPSTEPDETPREILTALGVRGVERATPVTGGADMAIWRVETASAHYALRLFRSDQVKSARREFAAMDQARQRGLPVPRVHCAGNWNGRPAHLLDWVPGQPLRDALVAAPHHAWALGAAFGRAQAAIHDCAPPPELEGDGHAWIGLANPDDALRRLLEEASGDRAALLHLDYHPMNVLVHDRRVSAVLDWTNACSGDRRADLARTETILRFAPLDEGAGNHAPVQVRQLFVAGWRHGYHVAAGPVDGMEPFLAWAGAFMARDLAPRVGRPDLPWLTGAFLERVQSWSATWRERAERR